MKFKWLKRLDLERYFSRQWIIFQIKLANCHSKIKKFLGEMEKEGIGQAKRIFFKKKSPLIFGGLLMVSLAGIEPATHGLKGRCSTY